MLPREFDFLVSMIDWEAANATEVDRRRIIQEVVNALAELVNSSSKSPNKEKGSLSELMYQGLQPMIVASTPDDRVLIAFPDNSLGWSAGRDYLSRNMDAWIEQKGLLRVIDDKKSPKKKAG